MATTDVFDTTSALIALVVLVAVFVIGSVTKLQMGIAALVAAALVGSFVYGESLSEIQAGFPLPLFFTLVGVTYLFALASNNGTVKWLVIQGLRLVDGRAGLFPFVVFIVTFLVTAVGAATPAAAAILMPIALAFNRQNRTNPLPMAQAVIQGATAGSFSPMGVYGVIVASVVAESGSNLAALYNRSVTWALVTAVCFGVVFFFWLAFRSSGPEPPATETGTDTAGSIHTDVAERLTVEKAITLFSLVGMALAVLIGGLDVGFTSLAVGAVLTLLFPRAASDAITRVAWPTIILVGGIVTYISLLERHGVIDWLGHEAAGLGNPRFTSVIILLVAAVVSAFASTTGILGALIPLSVPFLVMADGSMGAINATMLIAALCVSASVVDISPFSTNGALAVAGADYQSDYVYRRLFRWSFVFIAAAPLLAWGLLILPPWGG